MIYWSQVMILSFNVHNVLWPPSFWNTRAKQTNALPSFNCSAWSPTSYPCTRTVLANNWQAVYYSDWLDPFFHWLLRCYRVKSFICFPLAQLTPTGLWNVKRMPPRITRRFFKRCWLCLIAVCTYCGVFVITYFNKKALFDSFQLCNLQRYASLTASTTSALQGSSLQLPWPLSVYILAS